MDMNRQILKIRTIAGEMGEAQDGSPGPCDAENHDFHVQTGLAEAVGKIFEHDHKRLIKWFGYCLIECGAEIDPPLEALLDALERGFESQIQELDNDRIDPYPGTENAL